MTSPTECILETPDSMLLLHDLSPEWIEKLPSIAQEIDPSLNYHPAIMIFGKVYHQQRSVGFFSNESDGYHYSNSVSSSIPLTSSLKELLSYINTMFGAEYNGILINKYESGEETIGKHSDDERALDKSAGVLSLSVGAVRKFRIRCKTSGKIVADVPTHPDKIIQMAGNFQKEFTHEIPAEKKIKGVRYSFTFRRHI